MGFRINTNIAAMNAHTSGVANNRELSTSLERLSSGLRINKAADDASGLAIADSLRAQANSLGQSINNANDAIGIVQIADKAMDEQLRILDTIKVKATQAAQDGQTTETRKAIQADIIRLMEQLDNIANTTSYNGQQLLSGAFTNKEFQVGAFSNETVKASIAPTSSADIGTTRFETGAVITASQSAVPLVFKNVDGTNDIEVMGATISTSAGTGIGVLSEQINKYSDQTGVRSSWQNQVTASAAIEAFSGDIGGLTINDVMIGDFVGGIDSGEHGVLVEAINKVKDQTGVEAYTDNRGHLNIRSLDGRGIEISGTGLSHLGMHVDGIESYGRLSVVRLDSRDIVISIDGQANTSSIGFHNAAEENINLRALRGEFSADQRSAIGANAHTNIENASNALTAGVTTLRGAMAVMDIAESAQKTLNSVRSDLGSVQNQLTSTINNISVTQVNVQASESQIRDVDFAAESSNFQKHNILAQSGSYAMSQANAVQQNVMQLLQ